MSPPRIVKLNTCHSLAQILNFVTLLSYSFFALAAAQWRDLGIQDGSRAGAQSAAPRSRRNRRFTKSRIDALIDLQVGCHLRRQATKRPNRCQLGLFLGPQAEGGAREQLLTRWHSILNWNLTPIAQIDI